MKKEIIISLIIVIAVIVGNIVTQNYTRKCAKEISKELLELKEIIKSEEKEALENKIRTVSYNWDEMQEKLAYYVEHDELEKVETQLSILTGEIEAKLYPETLPEIEKCIFILEHIEDKTALNIKNIF